MKNSNLLATLTLLASLTSCSLIKVNGLSGNKSTAPTSRAAADSPNAIVPPGDPIKGAPADDGAYQKISYEQFTHTNDLDGDYAFRQVGGSANHPERGGNPDPTWILRWESPMSQDEAKTIIAQAAINRTWLARAEKDFATWWIKIEPLATAQAAAIAKIEAGAGNHYERTIALRALWSETNKAAAAVELADNPMLQFQVASSIAKSNTAANVGFATRRFLIAINANTNFPSEARALETKEKERNLFLLAAADGEFARSSIGTPKLPQSSQNAKTRTAIKWPVAAAQEKQLREQLKNNQSVVAAWMTEPPTTTDFDRSDAPGPVWVEGHGQGDNVADGNTSKKVTAIGKDQFTLTGYIRRSVPYNCKADIVTGLDGSRTVGRNCSFKQDDTKVVITLKASEMPVKIQLGDEVSFHGTRTAQQTKNKVTTAEIDALYITKVVRKNALLFTE